MSLVKALAGRRRYSASARVWVGGFDKKQAYRLLRCVDKDGDRRVALRDLVAFVFVTWTEELTRLARAGGEHEEVRQRRRQLQKVQHSVRVSCRLQGVLLPFACLSTTKLSAWGRGGGRRASVVSTSKCYGDNKLLCSCQELENKSWKRDRWSKQTC